MTVLKCKNDQVFKAVLIRPWHPILIDLYLWIINEYPESLMTDAYRDGSGIHGCDPQRAFDLRSRTYRNPEQVYDDINKNWMYDPERTDMQVCVFHSICPNCGGNHNIDETGYVKTCVNCGVDISGNWHFHCQIHPNTIFIGDHG